MVNFNRVYLESLVNRLNKGFQFYFLRVLETQRQNESEDGFGRWGEIPTLVVGRIVD